MYQASQRLRQIAPTSEEAVYWFATDALNANRFSAALAPLHKLDNRRGWLDEGYVFSQLERDVQHYAGDFEGELASARRERSSGASDRRHG